MRTQTRRTEHLQSPSKPVQAAPGRNTNNITRQLSQGALRRSCCTHALNDPSGKRPKPNRNQRHNAPTARTSPPRHWQMLVPSKKSC
eukprot:5772496-Amphidinium_carterae.2